ncbi:MAG TPA: ABC transporter ATP-binding protein [Peptococcaceae bacterium]|nr:ABC transporter ATP-binding protein [Peptococcaceae bacterium]
MLEIKNLKVSYNGLTVLKGIDLTLKKGESLAIIGETGAGKTTLALSILGLVEGHCTGEILFHGRNLLDLPEEELRSLRGRQIAMVFQNIEDALHPLYTISQQVMEAILVHGEKDEDFARERARRLLARVGFDERRAEAYPHQLSGGEKQRALICIALANDPEILILDEPTAALDALTKAEIIALLREVTREKATLVITHDIAAAAKLAERIAVLYGGRILEMGPTVELLEFPMHPYTRGLLRSYPNMTTTKDLQGIPGRMSHRVSGCPFHPRCTQKIAVCEQEVPELQKKNGRYLACHRGGIVPLLEVRNISKSFGKVEVLHDVDLTLYEGETLALVGESGSGKTTLAKTIMGLFKAEQGEVFLEGEKVLQRKKRFYERVQMVFQNPGESISHRMNVYQAVKEPLDVHGWGSESEKLEKVRKVLNEVELPADDGFLKKYPHHLSGGEAQRVAIARALVLNPKLLIADEPTSALDASVQAKILRLLLDLQEKRGLALLLITHDLALARKVSDRMAVMLQGSIVEEGPTSEVVSNPFHPYTKCLVEAAPALSRGASEPVRASRGVEIREGVAQLSSTGVLSLRKQILSTDFTKGNSKTGSRQCCPFVQRCPHPLPRCYQEKPEMKACSAHRVACFREFQV